MTGRLEGRVALITGGAGGIGFETARQFLAEGMKVALVDLRNENLDDAVEALGNPGDSVMALAADVTSEPATEKYVADVLSRFGTIDVLFNNAGIEGRVRPIVDTVLADFDRVMSVNVHGAFLALKHVLPVLYAKRRGSVINTSSVGGLGGRAGLAPYTTSKHALVGLTRTAALEAAEFGVRVNSIHPSAVNTRMMRSLESGFSPEDLTAYQEAVVKSIPLGRYAEPSDVAKLVLFLASDDSEFITGAQYAIDGGRGAS